MDSKTKKITELGEKPIGKLLLQYALPAIIAMTATSLYNMVDSIFIGHGVGALAISGLALSFPLMNLAAAFGSLVGLGGATIISLRLGQRDYKTAQKVLGNIVVLNLIIGILFGGVVLSMLDPILYFFGASEATIGYAREYMQIILYGNVITHMFMGLSGVIRSAGHPKMAMVTTLCAVLLNIILDPIFIYLFDMGIQGAAFATILAQAVSLYWQIKILSNKKDVLHLKKGIFKLKKSIMKSILSIGMSPFLMNFAACIIVIFINKGLNEYGGDLNVGAYGIVNRLAFIFVMIVMGINQGMQPIAGYNYGAKNFSRVISVFKLSAIAATCITTLGFIVGVFFPEAAVRLFTTDESLITLSIEGMRITFLLFPIIGFQMVSSHYFQSVGKAQKAILLSLSRQVLFLLPAIIILPQVFIHHTDLQPSWGIWCAIPFSDFLSFILTTTLISIELKKINSKKL